MACDVARHEPYRACIGRKFNQRNPKCQNIDVLKTAILQEWQLYHPERRDYDVAKMGFKTRWKNVKPVCL
jgi:hypothetical protein